MKKNKLNKMERRIHTVSNFESSRITGKGFKNGPSGTDPTNTTITTLTTVSTLPGSKG